MPRSSTISAALEKPRIHEFTQVSFSNSVCRQVFDTLMNRDGFDSPLISCHATSNNGRHFLSDPSLVVENLKEILHVQQLLVLYTRLSLALRTLTRKKSHRPKLTQK